jgi:hypothetical protein
MKPRKSRALAVREVAHIMPAVADFLRLDNWEVRHLEYGFDKRSNQKHGEPGMADLQCIRYAYPGLRDSIYSPQGRITLRREAEVLWIELKSISGILDAEQRGWIMARRLAGALVWVAKEDFPPTIEGFMEHYRASGLLVREGL